MIKYLIFTVLTLFFTQKSWAQTLYTSLDWHMVAVVSNNDYTNGASDGAPGVTLGADFGGIAIEGFYKKYKLEETIENSNGETEVKFKDNIFGIGARLTHNIFFMSRFGILIRETSASAVNSRDKIVKFDVDGTHVGFYFGGGIQLPISDDFFFQTSLNLETGATDLTSFGFFVGVRYHFIGL
jgi:hypothetical protein